MADTFIQFSFEVQLVNNTIKEWANDFLSYPEKHGRFIEDECPEFEWDSPGFDWSIKDNSMEIWADCQGNVENVIVFLEELLKQEGYTPDKIGFCYSYSCSKPRVGEFGGCGIKIARTPSGTSVNYLDTNEWIAG
jgi:hypothetical protein